MRQKKIHQRQIWQNNISLWYLYTETIRIILTLATLRPPIRNHKIKYFHYDLFRLVVVVYPTRPPLKFVNIAFTNITLKHLPCVLFLPNYHLSTSWCICQETSDIGRNMFFIPKNIDINFYFVYEKPLIRYIYFQKQSIHPNMA